MKIIVCVKQVPDTNEVRIDPVKGTLIRDGVPSILNPEDANALEAALRLKEQEPNTEVAVLSMGPPQACEMLRECLAMGADEAYLLSDRAFGGADTCATSATLAAGIRKIGAYDLIFAGRQAIDGDTAQVGPQLAQRLSLPIVTCAEKLENQPSAVAVTRQTDAGLEKLLVRKPCVVTAVKEIGAPRYLSIGGIETAYQKNITLWNHEDVGLSPQQCGLNASPTQVMRSFTPPVKGKGEMLSGTAMEMASSLMDKLRAQHIVQ